MDKTQTQGKVYGYVRVSTKDQNEDRQVIALREFGVSEPYIVIEKVSGRDFNREAYRRLMKKLRARDTLVIKSIDRLGRNYDEIIEEWRVITKVIEAQIVVIDMPLLSTRQERSDLTSAFVADIVLQILSYVAELEKSMNHQRQAEGIAAAKTKGVVFGRPSIDKPVLFESLHSLWKQGEISAREAARRLGISHPTFLKWTGKL